VHEPVCIALALGAVAGAATALTRLAGTARGIVIARPPRNTRAPRSATAALVLTVA
jgi:hypothetical protein